MKRPAITSLALAFLTITGCRKESTPDNNPPEEKSTMATAIDGFTGRTAVEQGEMAKKIIKEVSAEKKADIDAVLDDQPN